MPPDSLDANASRLGNRSRWQSRDRMQSACSIPLLPRHHGRLGVICSILLGRSFRNKSSKDMAFPHPQSRKDHYRKEDKPSCGGIVWKFFKRTINITEYRNGKDDVNPAKNRTLGGIIHGRLRERGRCIVLRSPRFTTFEPPEAASWAFQYRTALRTRRSISASRRTSWPRRRRCVQSAQPRGAAQGRRSKCASPRPPTR